ncbi:MAG: hypothetical protein CMM50_00430 [Rhodospirillaceae bacterium]|nr:hypothetical protein [Rhodospirillaceae bacterium]|tara:strand:+ start:852 stop:1121 length:270 start_codon:yes stop_codon:yes gene_type:complete
MGISRTRDRDRHSLPLRPVTPVQTRELTVTNFAADSDNLPETDFSLLLGTYLHPAPPLEGGQRRVDKPMHPDPLLIDHGYETIRKIKAS